MKISIISIFLFVAPIVVFAAGNDVTLTTDAVIQVGSYTINISGSSAVIQSITVNPTNFTVTLASGSAIKVSSPGLYELSTDVQSDVTASVCSGAESSLTLAYSGTGTVTNTVTPSATSCSTATPGAPTITSATAGNGQAVVSFSTPSQGGSPITSYTITSSPGGITATGSASPITITGLSNGTAYTFTVVTTNSSGNGPASSASNQVTPTAPQSSSSSSSSAGGTISSGGGSPVSPTALAAILAPSASTTEYLNSLLVSRCPAGYTCTPVPGVSISTTTANILSVPSYPFTTDLTLGSTGSAVKALQAWLNDHGYAVASSGPGSPGNETDYFGPATRAALVVFQKVESITPAVGYFGPLTRAAIEKSGGMSVSQRSPTISFMRDLATGSIGADVKALQTYLNAHGFTVASSGPGSSGHETMTFGPGTKAALVKFQKANGISPAVGYFGPKTRAAIQIQ